MVLNSTYLKLNKEQEFCNSDIKKLRVVLPQI